MHKIGLFLLLTVIAVFSQVNAKTIRFSGRNWTIRPSSGKQGPGPNNWDENNAWVDGNGWLHLKLTNRNGQWYAAEVFTEEKLGFGQYQWQISGRIDRLDRNIVFGLFNYPRGQPDGTHEIDIEFAKWGRENGLPGSYTVWPVTLPSSAKTSHQYPLQLNGDYTTHSFTWKSRDIVYSSNHGHQNSDDVHQFASWTFRPSDPEKRISRTAMPVHINLWLFQGQVPVNGQEVELIVHNFKFTPM